MQIPGVNIQWPWSELILSGEKTVETRTYPLPAKYKDVALAVIETPGARGRREAGIQMARIIGTVTFADSFQYKSKAMWIGDQQRHRVLDGDPLYGWSSKKEKWGWIVKETKLFSEHHPAPVKRGIIFASACSIEF